MSDTEGTKKTGYRLDYASSGRSKCKGASNPPVVWPIALNPALVAFHASFARHRSQAVRPIPALPLVHFFLPLFRCNGTAIGKGELRFGSLVDFRGNTSLCVISLVPTSPSTYDGFM